LEISGLPGTLVAALDTDGTDGPTDVAGGLVDGHSLQLYQQAGIDPFQALRSHNVTPALVNMGDAICTGQTGTNINDLKILLVK
jgi:glycerate-2-kinase